MYLELDKSNIYGINWKSPTVKNIDIGYIE